MHPSIETAPNLEIHVYTLITLYAFLNPACISQGSLCTPIGPIQAFLDLFAPYGVLCTP
jgi:hypothetical protein